jgi:hypothetical protein
MTRRAPKPARTYVQFGYSVDDGDGCGPLVFRLPSEPAPGVVEALRASGPVVDTMAISIGVRKPLMPQPFERERRWLVTMLALAEGDAMYAAMDAAQEALREDLNAGNVLPGAHPGSAWTPSRATPAEAALRAFREQTVEELEREEDKRQADRLKAMRRRRRWWRRSAAW